MNRLLVLSSLALSLSCGAAFAQQSSTPQSTDPQQAPAPQSSDAPMHHGHHRPNPHRQAEMLSRRLNLTPDQTRGIEPILASRDQQMEALHGNTQLAPADRHAQMKSINEQAEQQMSAVLSPDQMVQLKAMRRGGHHRGQNEQNGDNSQAPGV